MALTGHDLSPALLRRLFLAGSAVWGLLLTFLTPPFQVPDEPMHFRRIIAVSEGDLLARLEDGRVGSELPANLPEIERILLDGIPGDPSKTFSFDRVRRTWTRGPASTAVFLDYPTAALFSPLPYLAPGLSVRATFTLGGSILTAFFIARLVNLAIGILLIWLALRVAPELSSILFGCALLPMVLFLRSSLSADVLTFSLAWLVLALIARELSRVEFVLWRHVVGFTLILTKPLFVLVALLGFIRPIGTRNWRQLAGYAVTVSIAIVIAAQIASSVLVPYRSDVPTDPRGQMQRTLQEPLSVGRTVLIDSVVHLPRYGVELVGRLGWLDTPLPLAAVALIAVAIVMISLTSPSPVWMTTSIRAVLLMTAIVGALAILWSQFVLWTPPQATGIEGAQGRHFLPILPLPLIAVMGVINGREKGMKVGSLLLIGVGSPVVTIAAVVFRYWI